MRLNETMREMSFVGRCAVKELYRENFANGIGDGWHVNKVLGEYRKQKARINKHVNAICEMRGIAY